jgi:5-methylcytosine-specific restriction endonuclease McrA
VKSLAPPSVDARAFYVRISGRRRPSDVRERLQQAEEAVFGTYLSYTRESDDVTILDRADTRPATGDDLIGNYESKSVEALRLRAEIFANNEGGKCAFCGQVTAATIDHYLPSRAFPEFAILPLNLVPVCWQCNHRKGTLYRHEAALFLHCYFDPIPRDLQFLFADVELNVSGVTFRYWVNPPAQFGRLQVRIRSHFDRLGLDKEYAIEAINEYSERREQLRRVYETGCDGNDVAQYLTDEALSVATEKGWNHWRFVALDAMAKSPAFCNGGFLV